MNKRIFDTRISHTKDQQQTHRYKRQRFLKKKHRAKATKKMQRRGKKK